MHDALARPLSTLTRFLLGAAALLAVGLAPADPNPLTYPLGANLVPPADGGGVVFRCWAPNAATVKVAGQFNGWNPDAPSATMTKDAATSIWSAWVAAAVTGQEYKFVVGGTWKVDPYTRDSVNSTGNGIIRGDGSTYDWQATNWQTPDRDRMVIYELHLGSFSGNGDGGANYPGKFRDAVDLHGDYLKALGINIVEIMPVHEFPGGISWGYNPVHFFAPESDYGTPDDFRYMVDEFHKRGIGVVLDTVWNHTSNSDNNLWQFDGPANIYYYETGDPCTDDTAWGPRPDFSKPRVSAMFADNSTYWLREFRLDGYRLDATRAMRGYCNENGAGWNTLKAIVVAADAVNPRALLSVEDLPNDAAMTTPQSQGGAGYDAQWADNFHDVMRAQLEQTNPDMGAISGVLLGSGFGRPAAEAIKFVDNHDESGNGRRISVAIDPTANFSARAQGLTKVAAAMVILSPGIPMILQGQEFMENKKFGDQQGDRIWWGFLEDYQGIVDFHAVLFNLRTSRGSLKSSSGGQIIHSNDTANVIAFQRFDSQGDVTFVIANFSASTFNSYLVGVPGAGTWYELAGSDNTNYNGTGVINGPTEATATPRDGQPATLDVTLPPYSVSVFSKTPLATPAQPMGLFVR